MLELRKARKAAGLTQVQVAAHIGINQNTYYYWESGKTRIDSRSLQRLAELFGVTTDYLLGNDASSKPQKKGIKIPVLGRVQAGLPIDAVQDIIDYEEITPEMAASGDFFALAVQGDSMAPVICRGDVVVVQKQESAENGDIVVVLVNRGDATVKKFSKTEQGVKLVPLNPNYEPSFFTAAEVDSLPVVVVGKVVELRRKF